MYVYIESEHNANGSLWTVGFYSPDGKWNPESDHETQESAAKRVHYLNERGREQANRIEFTRRSLLRQRNNNKGVIGNDQFTGTLPKDQKD